VNKKSILVLVLVIAIMSSVCNVVGATDSYVSRSESLIEGVKVYAKDVQNTFESGGISKGSYDKVAMDIKNININGNNIKIEADVKQGDDIANILLKGNMYNSYKQQEKGIESYVGALKDDYNVFEVVYFGLKNSDKEDRVLFLPSLNNKKNIILYLKDKEGNVFAFQDELNKIKVDFSELQCDKIADPQYDMGWFINMLKPHKSKVEPFDSKYFPNHPVNQITTKRSDGYYLWTGDMYYESYIVGWELYEFYASPYFEGYINDVPQAGDVEWTSSLKLAQSTYINDEFQDYHNAHFYKITNGSSQNIQCTVAAGENTRLQSRDYGYKWWKNGSVKTSGAIWATVGVLCSTQPATNYAYNIANAISQISGWETKEISDNTYETLESYCRVDSFKVSEDVEICCDDNKLDIGHNVLIMDDEEDEDNNTLAAVNWKFALEFNGNIIDNDIDETEEVGYTTNCP